MCSERESRVEPAALGMAARVASTLIKPLVAKLFVQEQSGAELVDKPIHVSRLVSWRGQKRTLDERDVRVKRRAAVRGGQARVRPELSRRRPPSVRAARASAPRPPARRCLGCC